MHREGNTCRGALGEPPPIMIANKCKPDACDDEVPLSRSASKLFLQISTFHIGCFDLWCLCSKLFMMLMSEFSLSGEAMEVSKKRVPFVIPSPMMHLYYIGVEIDGNQELHEDPVEVADARVRRKPSGRQGIRLFFDHCSSLQILILVSADYLVFDLAVCGTSLVDTNA